ncbi:MAG: translation initiation factor IF-2 subunit alpha [Candidatus Micrarchaeota archaeon]|nr:translation initiation factor IF-2 subunit alpha [Candidatus Micrarchaeota archaeon]
MEGLPEQDELVLVSVKKIMPYGAFCTLDEYGGKEAFVHISEVAPRWIKNIHEFLHEGQKLVAKVYHVDASKGQIDLSLKRVTESEKKAKMEGARREKRAEKLFEVALKVAKSTKAEALTAQTALVEKYGSIVDAIEALAEGGEAALAGIRIEKGLAKALVEVTAKSMRKAKAELNGLLSLTSYSPDGVEEIKQALLSSPKPQDAKVELLYLGAPHYQIRVVAEDYKAAQKAMESTVQSIMEEARKRQMSAEFSKLEK